MIPPPISSQSKGSMLQGSNTGAPRAESGPQMFLLFKKYLPTLKNGITAMEIPVSEGAQDPAWS